MRYSRSLSLLSQPSGAGGERSQERDRLTTHNWIRIGERKRIQTGKRCRVLEAVGIGDSREVLRLPRVLVLVGVDILIPTLRGRGRGRRTKYRVKLQETNRQYRTKEQESRDITSKRNRRGIHVDHTESV